MTTGNFSSIELLGHEEGARFRLLTPEVIEKIGTYAAGLCEERGHAVTISIELDGTELFRKALPGASEEHSGWITRKSRVVNLTHHSTMYERVKAEEEGRNWHLDHGVADETHAIHGGGFPLATRDGEFRGVFLISGLPQVEDHLLAFEILRNISHQLATD